MNALGPVPRRKVSRLRRPRIARWHAVALAVVAYLLIGAFERGLPGNLGNIRWFTWRVVATSRAHWLTGQWPEAEYPPPPHYIEGYFPEGGPPDIPYAPDAAWRMAIGFAVVALGCSAFGELPRGLREAVLGGSLFLAIRATLFYADGWAGRTGRALLTDDLWDFELTGAPILAFWIGAAALGAPLTKISRIWPPPFFAVFLPCLALWFDVAVAGRPCCASILLLYFIFEGSGRLNGYFWPSRLPRVPKLQGARS